MFFTSRTRKRTGKILFEGRDLAKPPESKRGQGRLAVTSRRSSRTPTRSLNPRHTVGALVGGAAGDRRDQCRRSRSCRECRNCSKIVGLEPGDTTTASRTRSPGGQRQRIGTARALTRNPKPPAADEPVSALDVSKNPGPGGDPPPGHPEEQVQGRLPLHRARRWRGARHFCPEVAATHLGKIVELAAIRETLLQPPGPPVHPGPALRRTRRQAGAPSVAGANGSGSRATYRSPIDPAVRGLPLPDPASDRRGDLARSR